MSESPAEGQHRYELSDVATMFGDLATELRSEQSPPFDAVTTVAQRRVSGVDAASVTWLERNRYSTVASTDRRATQADEVQYQLQSGPCVDAITEQPMYAPDDLAHDDRWPKFGQKVHEDFGWSSMLSFRLFCELSHGDVAASLNLYARESHAFDGDAQQVGLLLATHAAAVVSSQVNRTAAQNLQVALQNSREIGIAIGVLMSSHKLTREEAFAMLRITSQDLNRKLHAIAQDVADTGSLPASPRPPRRNS